MLNLGIYENIILRYDIFNKLFPLRMRKLEIKSSKLKLTVFS